MASVPYSECEEIGGPWPIRQGDILEWLETPSPIDPWRQFGVVVTADCDIALKKHQGLLSYVPVLPLTDYLRLFYLPRLIERAVQPVWTDLVNHVRTLQADNLADFPEPLSEDAIGEWVLSATPETLVGELRAEGSDAASLRELVSAFRDSRAATDAAGFRGQFACLIGLRTRQGGSAETSEQKLWNDISNFVDNLPGDCFFINALSHVHAQGYVAYLRLIREVGQGQIATRESDFRRGAVARRIARLGLPFLHRLTQQLIEVFASIGLPEEYETQRRAKVDALAKTNPGVAESGGVV